MVGGLALGGTNNPSVAARIVGNLPRKQLGLFVALTFILLNG